jgi:hypothetical protein
VACRDEKTCATLITAQWRIRARLVHRPYYADPMNPSLLLPAKSFQAMIFALLATALFTGCATISPQDRQLLQDHKIPAPLYEKMLHREGLALPEIAQLSARRVPPEFIIRYIDHSLAEYQLTTDDVLVLRSAGVSNKVIDYLLTIAPKEQVVVNRYPYWPNYTRTVIIDRHHRHHHRRR